METFIKVLSGIVLVVIIGLVLSLPVMWLWNAVMPDVFGLIRIDFWQAVYLNLLGGFLFSSSNSSSE